jgi:hypothetical protein
MGEHFPAIKLLAHISQKLKIEELSRKNNNQNFYNKSFCTTSLHGAYRKNACGNRNKQEIVYLLLF